MNTGLDFHFRYRNYDFYMLYHLFGCKRLAKGYKDVCEFMLVTFWGICDEISIFVTSFWYGCLNSECYKAEDVCDENDGNRHENLKVVAKTSSTFVTNIAFEKNPISSRYFDCQKVPWFDLGA